jgi:nucleosome binding factor SPN SPT16 subunit
LVGVTFSFFFSLVTSLIYQYSAITLIRLIDSHLCNPTLDKSNNVMECCFYSRTISNKPVPIQKHMDGHKHDFIFLRHHSKDGKMSLTI